MNPCAQSRRIAFVGDHVPRRCGIATFTQHLCDAVAAREPEADCLVVAVNDRPEGYDYPARVRFEIQQQDLDSYHAAADELNQCRAGVLCVQHEFGIYGGPAGSHLLVLLREVRMPVVTTLHTVLHEPDPDHRHVMDELAARSERLVVMARKGAEILRDVYGVPDGKIDVIPHGIPDVPFAPTSVFKGAFDAAGKSVLLTFGLLGPGKGIEYAIEAMPEIVRRHPQTMYLVLGATHPHLLAREGEKYRTRLEHLARNLGVGEQVVFYNRFVSAEDLSEFIGAADIYLTPYLNEAQITSGTLAFVFGAGRVVVSTPYWHAAELLAGGRGELVPFRDPGAITDAVCGLLDEPERVVRMQRQAYETSRSTVWSAVAGRYLASFERAASAGTGHRDPQRMKWRHATRAGKLPPVRLNHLVRLTDGTGIFQHAMHNVPNHDEGYCTDDNARAFILCNLLAETHAAPPEENLDLLATRYLAFLAAALDREGGRFRNFMNYQRQWIGGAGSEDSHGRALWALGTGASRSENEGHRALCATLFGKALAATEAFTSPRAWAFALLGIHEFTRGHPLAAGHLGIPDELVARLFALHRRCSETGWHWFEPYLTYENARLCQALVSHGHAAADPAALETGLNSLEWLVARQKSPAGNFRPVGSEGFFPKGGPRADFDQQPVEAQATVAACLEAFRCTGDAIWKTEARLAFDWFLGRNDLGLPLHDPATGGCGDGLEPGGLNENQGAESTLAFLISLAELTVSEHSLPTTTP